MVTIKSNISEKGDEFFNRIDKQMELAVTRAMTRTALLGEARVKSIMEKEAYDTGRLLRSVVSKIIKSPDLMRLVIGSNLSYAAAIEQGRKPGKWPNLDALTAWVGRKLRQNGVNAKVNVTFDQLKALARTGGKKATKQQQAYRKQLAVIYLVGRKISTKGIRQKLIFQRIQDGLLAWFRQEVQKEIKAIK
jgi:hypothetical protein